MTEQKEQKEAVDKGCNDKYKSFIKDGNLNTLNACYFNPDKFKSEVTSSPNPLNVKETCRLINNKKLKYYTHTYNPKNIVAKIEADTSSYKKVLIENINNIFDLTVRDKCCNCIAISLYWTKTNDIDGLLKYLYSIQRTVKNVKSELPDWIVRVYIDGSVYNNMQTGNTYVNEIMNYLHMSDNVEIYTYICDSLLDNNIPIARTRTFRFLPITDIDVNVCVVREADGIVTYTDCHNIKVFANSDRIFYLLPFLDDYDNTQKIGNSYQRWLSYYKKRIESEYFTKNFNLYDILAGTIAIRLKVKHDIYLANNSYVQNKINEAVDKASVFSGEEDIDIDDTRRAHILHPEMLDKDKNELKNALNNGYDEILLLHIFRDIISVSYSGDKYTKEEFDLKRSLIFAGNDIKVIKINDLVIKSYIYQHTDKPNIHNMFVRRYKTVKKTEMIEHKEDEYTLSDIDSGYESDLDNPTVRRDASDDERVQYNSDSDDEAEHSGGGEDDDGPEDLMTVFRNMLMESYGVTDKDMIFNPRKLELELQSYFIHRNESAKSYLRDEDITRYFKKRSIDSLLEIITRKLDTVSHILNIFRQYDPSPADLMFYVIDNITSKVEAFAKFGMYNIAMDVQNEHDKRTTVDILHLVNTPYYITAPANVTSEYVKLCDIIYDKESIQTGGNLYKKKYYKYKSKYLKLKSM